MSPAAGALLVVMVAIPIFATTAARPPRQCVVRRGLPITFIGLTQTRSTGYTDIP